MTQKTLIYKSERTARFKKSAIYALPIVGRVFSLCSQYLLHSMRKRLPTATTDAYLERFWRLHFEETCSSLYVTGQEELTPNQTYVFMSNHESWLDIPAMFGAVPTSLRMVSKIGLMQIPVLGHAMTNAGFIAVDRKNRSRAIRQLDYAKRHLAEGVSIWIAPEGTRSRDGTIGAFKKGGFYLAKELNMPIAPVYIEGTAKIMSADSLVVHPNQDITVHFCKPVSVDEVAHLSNAELVTMVRERIIEKQNSCRQTGDKP